MSQFLETARPMLSKPEVTMCQTCIMDTTDPAIVFHEEGTCSHCRPAMAMIKELTDTLPQRSVIWEKTVEKIKKAGKGREFDCIMGVSGGVDSSYAVMIAKESGLRPIAVHLDNGWNSELAVANIKNLLNFLKVPLVTEVLNWEVFRKLQLAFLHSSTPDSEAPTDHAITATLYRYAKKFGTKYCISGVNPYTESVGVAGWSDGHGDWRYISQIYQKFTGERLKDYVHLNAAQMIAFGAGLGFQNIKPFFLMPFSTESVQTRMEKEFGWRSYGGKHYENVYTKFFQGYILPVKFGFDKRRAHLSSLICAGQISREAALSIIAEPAIPPDEMTRDYAFVCKKLGISVEEMQGIILAPPKRYGDYPNSEWLVKLPHRLGKTRLRRLWTSLVRLPRSV